MEIHPSLVIRSMIVGCIVVIALTSFITANATTPLKPQDQAAKLLNSDLEGCEISQDFPQKVRKWCDLIELYAHQHAAPARPAGSVDLAGERRKSHCLLQEWRSRAYASYAPRWDCQEIQMS